MTKPRPYVLSIAATDPSAGAGVLADIKTLEANKVYGLGVVSGITYQNDNTFTGVDWVPVENITRQAEIVLTKFPVKVTKIGLIQSLPVLETIIDFLLGLKPDLKIIWDPILKASAGFTFHDRLEQEALLPILKKLFLLTPNVTEACSLGEMDSPEESALQLSQYCHVLLKGGHRVKKLGRDTLYLQSGEKYSYRPKEQNISAKHGSGCVLSAALAANLAQNYKLPRACLRAKQYTTKFLTSNANLLGYHQT
ncbi:hydroxymethylpyrimidine/phosphomethylpyrimidine kinase [Adhaeribacter aerolatus]|uniref:hydroxymethylpyrimidine kinase n=1 Tax=Adhaeribacter aerolatus TaxID=670289 RepID=A0A512B681_9BACT|nr:hydroxymethylpyrimidine/phosphomethylpyrimidine kinase [Adhaeribacter aerolatus]GEO07463.1 hydroxymethylpyrimidine/phosphomethylpyrimidine kinase [Adhaeribacter aerolatus]